MDFTEHIAPNGVLYLTAPTIPCRHAFTTRVGGVSTGDQAGLNLSVSPDPDFSHVAENVRRLGAGFGIDTGRMAFTKQVHGNVVRTVTGADVHVLGTPMPYEAAGLVTNEPGLALICFTADCVPVLLCDAAHGVVGAIHCGWRSSVADILKNALTQMESLGARAEDVRAAIGPAIGKCCFETDDDVPEAVTAWLGGDTEGLFAKRADGKTLVDLRGANARRLLQLGVPAEGIDISEECTYCSHEKYWSHRYTKGKRGGQAAVICLNC